MGDPKCDAIAFSASHSQARASLQRSAAPRCAAHSAARHALFPAAVAPRTSVRRCVGSSAGCGGSGRAAAARGRFALRTVAASTVAVAAQWRRAAAPPLTPPPPPSDRGAEAPRSDGGSTAALITLTRASAHGCRTHRSSLAASLTIATEASGAAQPPPHGQRAAASATLRKRQRTSVAAHSAKSAPTAPTGSASKQRTHHCAVQPAAQRSTAHDSRAGAFGTRVRSRTASFATAGRSSRCSEWLADVAIAAREPSSAALHDTSCCLSATTVDRSLCTAARVNGSDACAAASMPGALRHALAAPHVVQRGTLSANGSSSSVFSSSSHPWRTLPATFKTRAREETRVRGIFFFSFPSLPQFVPRRKPGSSLNES